MIMRNRLDETTSPYLHQHRDNPVHWQPWDNTALAEARDQERPILLSIGYAACHWCHVMAHESFEDPAIADLMNRHFVNIKVDREERPDLDQIYQRALALLGEQGGWPLTMFLTPKGEPFWGGTYFPPTSRYGRPGFTDVLKTIDKIWHSERDKVEQNRTALLEALGQLQHPRSGEPLPLAAIDQTSRHLTGAFDPVNGGLQGAPKFPQAPILSFLWHHGRLHDDPEAKAVVRHSLNRMCQGGIYDHLGGGFARYSVDAEWLVPHFEKMLYDNASILALLAEVHAAAPDPLFGARAAETVGWLAREMMVEDAFAASLDADSEGVEGKFYVWDSAEIDQALGPDAERFKAVFGVAAGGNWEGRTILNRLDQPGLGDEQDEARLRALADRLLELRAARVRPGRDDKVLADWNGLMIAALVRAAEVFAQPAWADLGARAFAFITRTMETEGRLAHSWREDRRLDLAFVDDYAQMIGAALALHRYHGTAHYLEAAERWVVCLDRDFRDPETGGYFQTGHDATDLPVRPKYAIDGPTPAGNGALVPLLIALPVGDGPAVGAVLGDGVVPIDGEGEGAGSIEGDGVGGGATPRSAAIALRICVISDEVSQDGYVGGTIRSCLTEACAAVPKRFTRFGSESRGRSVQVKPLAAAKRFGALKIVSGPMSSRIASSSVCCRPIRP
jgi:uncharacterized protein YyaL (SSP411 family)